MQSLSLHQTASASEPLDLAVEVRRLESSISERRVELVALQEEFHSFKTRYTQIIGSRLAELAEVERALREAEARVLGVEAEEEIESAEAEAQVSPATQVGGIRKLFWAVARMFHPDHAADASEARRRHTVMAEASRAYREGDVESLHTLLGDEELQFFCTTTHAPEDDPEDLKGRLINLKEELRTVEFGLKRIRQDGLYQLKIKADEEASSGRDALAAQAESIDRQIVKARYRLAHLS
jgi:hypothetical protein